MQSLKEAYNGKNILITGHTGFKGSWLSLWLLEMGANVIGYSLEPDTSPGIFNELKLANKMTHIIGDIRNEEYLLKTIERYQPEIIFHLAAQPLVRYSYENPKLTYETNAMGTINLFEAIRKIQIPKVIVNITSDKCYENKEWVYGYRENEAMGGYDPYSNSKGVSELITSSYRNSFFNPKEYGKTHNILLASARAGNVIGGGDWSKDRLLPDCARSLSKDKEIIIRSPYSTRPWQFVLEPLFGYLLLAAKLYKEGAKYCEGWNFGPYDNSVLTVEEVVNLAIKYWGKGKLKIEKQDKLHEAKLLKLDISKAIYHLGWKPIYDAKQAINKTMIWYKTFYENKTNMYEFSLEQLEEYTNNISINRRDTKEKILWKSF